MKKTSAIILSILLLTFCASGCTKQNKANNGKDEIKIITSFYLVDVFTKNLIDGISSVTSYSLTGNDGGCLHDYQLLPKDIAALSDADIFVINGAGMERYMDNVVSQTRQLTIIDASTGIDLLPTHNEYNHDNDNNSHVWMSVKNAIVQVKNIAGKLCSAMPEHTDKIRENEKNYISSLEALDMEIKAELSSFSGTKIITFHEAYDYFARDYGLVIFDLIESSHGNEPSAKKLALLSREIKENDIKALFIEPKYSGTAANTLSTETGVKLYTINPITSGQDSLTAYEDIMRANVKTIRESIS